MTQISSYSSEVEAKIVAGMLASHGIKSEIVDGGSESSVFPAPDAGTVSVYLYVEDADAAEALRLLEEHGDLS